MNGKADEIYDSVPNAPFQTPTNPNVNLFVSMEQARKPRSYARRNYAQPVTYSQPWVECRATTSSTSVAKNDKYEG